MKLAFIGGSGHHYLRQLPAEPAFAETEIAVASDGHDAAASAAFAESLRHGGVARPVRWFDTGRELLDTFKPDLLSVGAVYGYNGFWNAAALERDIPTVTDKPAAATWPQWHRLRELASANPKRILLTEFNFRSRPEFRSARDAVLAGEIGTVVLATAQKSYRFGNRPSWYGDRDAYGGTMLWIASHGIDAIRFVTGQRFVRCVGRQGNLSQPRFGSMEDHVALLAELQSGATAIVHADFCRPAAAPTHGDDRLRIVGSHGVVEVTQSRCQIITEKLPPTDITNRIAVRPIHLELLAIALGEPSSLYSTSESLESAHVLLTARDSADRQQWMATERAEEIARESR
ncbi:MAG TPA: Gfo/Idh/MocA family oxidoreductase [Tepidisphaeraceae bacterium]|jgi:predicted dehydrogenase|nr:Gfo/Idh/MocA family oxidoreductase [Tepidisphaeraceae bacterium]